jgi:amino acid adenylation domain-containing protein
MMAELFKRYLGAETGEEAEEEERGEEASYRDYVRMEREALSSEEARAYWMEKLSESPLTELPRLSSRRCESGRERDGVQVLIPRQVVDGLKRLAQTAGVPLKSVLLAAHLRTLSLLSGQADVVTGLVSNGRPEVASGERILGLFLNTLPLRLSLPGGTWADLARETFEAEREMLPFRRYPLVQLQKMKGNQPIFEAAFNYIHFHVLENLSAGEGVEILGETSSGEANFPFAASFNLELSSSQIQLDLRYETSEFSDAQVRAIGNYYLKALGAMARNPQGRYETYSLLSEEERQQLLSEWNATARDYARCKGVHELLAEQAARNPLGVAAVQENQSLTYLELDSQANQLARYLQTRGVGADVIVGVWMERSLKMLVAQLGILKAGGAYLPLDPQYPPERLAFMLEDAAAPVLLTEAGLADALPQGVVKDVVRLDVEWETIARQSREALVSRVLPEHLAYVIYTSGSTGKPKGVAIHHAGLLNLVFWHRRAYRILPSTRATQVASPAFDASVCEIWPYLTAGASLYLPDEETRAAPKALLSWLAAHSITHCFLPTPLAEALLNELDERATDELALKVLLTGGDKLRRGPGAGLTFEFINHYGPTENTVATTCAPVREEPEGGLPSIGRPIDNTQVYVLDSHLQPVPPGVAGELYIGGEGLARGYLRRPELTAERFIPHAFSRTEGARLYRTGDLVRYLPDGNLEFIERIDEQVKVRGFRIELGEIEAALRQHDDVREAVVLATEGSAGDKQLVAYLVCGNAEPPTPNEWREYLKQWLPVYMIPAAFVFMEELPLTLNGKVDRKALLALERQSSAHIVYVAPRDLLELQLAQVWQEVLGLEEVGVESDFFELGGQSLLAVRLFAVIERRLDIKLPLSTLFQASTIAQQASLIRQQANNTHASSLVQIKRGGSLRPFFCVHAVGGHAWSYLNLARHLDAEQPFYAFQSSGLRGEEFADLRIETMAAHYLTALREVQPVGPYALGGWSMGGVVAYEMAQQLTVEGEEVSLLALFDSYAPSALEAEEEDELKLLVQFAQDLGLPLDQLKIEPDRLLTLEPDARLAAVLEQAHAAQIIHADVGLSQARLLYHLFRTNRRALRSYVPRRYAGRLVLFKAEEESALVSSDSLNGWAQWASGGVSLRSVPGNHYDIMREPHVRILAQELMAQLYQAKAVRQL